MASGKLLEGSRASFSPMRSSLALRLSSPSRAPRNSPLMSEITRRTDHAAVTLASKLCGILSRMETVTFRRHPGADSELTRGLVPEHSGAHSGALGTDSGAPGGSLRRAHRQPIPHAQRRTD